MSKCLLFYEPFVTCYLICYKKYQQDSMEYQQGDPLGSCMLNQSVFRTLNNFNKLYVTAKLYAIAIFSTVTTEPFGLAITNVTDKQRTVISQTNSDHPIHAYCPKPYTLLTLQSQGLITNHEIKNTLSNTKAHCIHLFWFFSGVMVKVFDQGENSWKRFDVLTRPDHLFCCFLLSL